MHPQYIKLTAVRVTMPPPTNQRGQPIGPAEIKMLQPPVVQLVPLPIAFNKGQVDGRAERNDSGVAVTYRELFDDVLEAINQAADNDVAIAVPIDRERIANAAKAMDDIAGMVPALAAQRIRATGISPTVQEAVETAVNGVRAALDAEEKGVCAFPQCTCPPEKTCIGDEEKRKRAVEYASMEGVEPNYATYKTTPPPDENDPKWKDFVQIDGESVGAPAKCDHEWVPLSSTRRKCKKCAADNLHAHDKNFGAPAYSREPKAGDLRIHSLQPGKFFLEQLREYELHGEPQSGWAAPELPFSLMRTFDSRDELIEAVEKAGRGKLLVNA